MTHLLAKLQLNLKHNHQNLKCMYQIPNPSLQNCKHSFRFTLLFNLISHFLQTLNTALYIWHKINVIMQCNILQPATVYNTDKAKVINMLMGYSKSCFVLSTSFGDFGAKTILWRHKMVLDAVFAFASDLQFCIFCLCFWIFFILFYFFCSEFWDNGPKILQITGKAALKVKQLVAIHRLSQLSICMADEILTCFPSPSHFQKCHIYHIGGVMWQFFSDKSKIFSYMQKHLHRCRKWVKQI